MTNISSYYTAQFYPPKTIRYSLGGELQDITGNKEFPVPPSDKASTRKTEKPIFLNQLAINPGYIFNANDRKQLRELITNGSTSQITTLLEQYPKSNLGQVIEEIQSELLDAIRGIR